MARTVPVLVCIDVEPDGPGTRRQGAQPWRGYEAANEFFGSMRASLTEATGRPAHFSWFVRMDPHVEAVHGSGGWAADHYMEQLLGAMRQGDEIGLHTHLYRADPGSGGWRIDYSDPGWVGDCVKSAFASFRSAFGRTPRSHRFGDRFLNSEALLLLESLGCLHDLTLEPGFRESAGSETGRQVTGELTDMRGAPERPYHPSLRNFREQDQESGVSLWEIPLSTGLARSNPLNPFGGSEFFTLQLGLAPRLFRPIAIKSAAGDGGYLATVLKTDMLLDVRLAANMRRNLEFLTSSEFQGRLAFATPAEALMAMEYVR